MYLRPLIVLEIESGWGSPGHRPLKFSPRSPLAGPFLGFSRPGVSHPYRAPGDNAGVRPDAIYIAQKYSIISSSGKIIGSNL